MKSLIWSVGLVFLVGCHAEQPPADDPPAAQTDESPDAQPGGFPPIKRRGNVLAPVRGAPNPNALPAPELTEELTFDVGTVVAGQVLDHTFQVKNSTRQTITVKEDRDIQLDCGCASIVPARRVLQAGDQTAVTVTVRTGGLKRPKGKFAQGGKIVWTLADGRRQATALYLRGEARPAFTSEPPTLAFLPEEVRRGAVKEVVVTANAPLDGQPWTVVSSSPYFKVVERAQPGVGGPVRCKVRCAPPEGVEEFRGEIRVTAQASPAGAAPFPVAMAVPVQARQAVDLAISPKVASVLFGPGGEPAEVKLVLRGDKVAKGQLRIEGVRYPGCRVTWKLAQTPGVPTAVLNVTLVRQTNKPSEQEPVLLIQLAGGKSIPWPVVEVGPSLDKP